VIKKLKKKAIERLTQIVAEICQNRTADKDQFFRTPFVAQICNTPTFVTMIKQSLVMQK
jgi:hypothetical protein